MVLVVRVVWVVRRVSQGLAVLVAPGVRVVSVVAVARARRGLITAAPRPLVVLVVLAGQVVWVVWVVWAVAARPWVLRVLRVRAVWVVVVVRAVRVGLGLMTVV